MSSPSTEMAKFPDSNKFIKLLLQHKLNTLPSVAETVRGKPFYEIYCIGDIRPNKSEYGPVPVRGGLMCRAGPEYTAEYLLKLLESTDLDEEDLVKIDFKREKDKTTSVYKPVVLVFEDLLWVAEQIEASCDMLNKTEGKYIAPNATPFDA